MLTCVFSAKNPHFAVFFYTKSLIEPLCIWVFEHTGAHTAIKIFTMSQKFATAKIAQSRAIFAVSIFLLRKEI